MSAHMSTYMSIRMSAPQVSELRAVEGMNEGIFSLLNGLDFDSWDDLIAGGSFFFFFSSTQISEHVDGRTPIGPGYRVPLRWLG